MNTFKSALDLSPMSTASLSFSMWDAVIALPVMVWVFGGQLLTADAYKILVGLSVLSFVISGWRHGWVTMWQRLRGSGWLQALGLLLVMAAMYKEYNGGVSNGLLRGYAIAWLFFLALPRYVAAQLLARLEWFLLLMAIVLCVNAILYHYVWMMPRSRWVINAIPFTTISAAIAILTLIRGIWPSNKVKLCLNTTAFVLSFNSLIIGQSRGTALAFLVALVGVLGYGWWRQVGSMYRFWLMVGLMLGSLIVNMNAIVERSEATQIEIEAIQANNTHTSIGIRLELWRASVHSLMESPWFGLGDQHQVHRQQLANEGRIDQAIVRWDHYHNQYIDTQIRRGVVGIALLALILVGPFMGWRRWPLEAQLSAGALVVVYTVAGLTDVPFDHVQPLLVFLVVVTLYERVHSTRHRGGQRPNNAAL
ncbi:O-antigen ligase [Vibrio sp. ES.051]|uniref:O-antigen ligase family protein n=1 Tax=Vibrio sp. ES.051 TaxID=1761909 RepID=UPI000BF3F805|nr:O-antigen ligase family protein [Vibrio sp. ES.051]PFG45456.1 O-antigen ligase [Vibrio sp. ES.051]